MLNYLKIGFLFSTGFLAACTSMSSKGLLGVAKIQQNYQSQDLNEPFQKNTIRNIDVAFFKADKWVVRKTPLQDGKYHFYQKLKRKTLGEIQLEIKNDEISNDNLSELFLSELDDYRYLDWPLSRMHFPVVLSHNKENANPENWSTGKITAVHNNLLQFFIEKFKIKKICNPQNDTVKTSIPLIPAEIEESFNFRNPKGEMIASFRIKSEDESTSCSEIAAPKQVGEKWYYSNAAGEILYIGNHLLFLDVNDYDQDGNSEWLFYKNFQGKESYVLFQAHQSLILEKEI